MERNGFSLEFLLVRIELTHIAVFSLSLKLISVPPIQCTMARRHLRPNGIRIVIPCIRVYLVHLGQHYIVRTLNLFIPLSFQLNLFRPSLHMCPELRSGVIDGALHLVESRFMEFVLLLVKEIGLLSVSS